MAEGRIIEQGSEGWRALRAGKLTASEFHTICDGTPVARESLMCVLAFERLAGQPRHEISAASLKWGTAQEQDARREYEFQSGNIALQAEFTPHPDYPFIGASPDFMVPPAGGGEIKSPLNEGVHVRTWLDGMPAEHRWQVQGGMMCTGAAWWDFCSWHPNAAPNLRLYRQRIKRDDSFIAEMLDSLLQFEAELRTLVKRLEAKGVAAAEFAA